MRDFEDADEYCPHCDNHFVIPMKSRETEGQLMIQIEGDAQMVRGTLFYSDLGTFLTPNVQTIEKSSGTKLAKATAQDSSSPTPKQC